MYSGSFCCRKVHNSLDEGDGTGSAYHIGHQPLVSRGIFSGQHNSLSDRGMLTKYRFDLT